MKNQVKHEANFTSSFNEFLLMLCWRQAEKQ